LNKLVDEYLKGVVTLQTTSPEVPSLDGKSGLEARATISVPKVRNLLSKQKELESSAKDGESPVCQVKQTLDL
jgi:hypothetical protein